MTVDRKLSLAASPGNHLLLLQCKFRPVDVDEQRRVVGCVSVYMVEVMATGMGCSVEWWRWWSLGGLPVAPFSMVFSRALYRSRRQFCDVRQDLGVL